MGYVRLCEGESPEALVNRFWAAVQQTGILGKCRGDATPSPRPRKPGCKRRHQEHPLTQTQAYYEAAQGL
jgi:hypothetical protein